MDITNCIFCEKGFDEGDLHKVLTLGTNVHTQKMLTELQDTQLLAKIGTNDLATQEIKYHLKCLTKLRNRYRSHKRKSQPQQQGVIDGMMSESRVFIELITYTEKFVDSGMLLFRLADLHTLYINLLGDLGIRKTVNKTRLKNDILKHFSEAQEQSDGKSIVIFIKRGMQNMLKDALKQRMKMFLF